MCHLNIYTIIMQNLVSFVRRKRAKLLYSIIFSLLHSNRESGPKCMVYIGTLVFSRIMRLFAVYFNPEI